MKTTHGAGRIGGTRLVLAVFLLAANYGWGSNGACSADPSYTQVSSYGSGTSAGCYATDKTFSNFVEQGGGALSLATVFLGADESGYTNGLGAYTVSALFSGSATGAAWTAGNEEVHNYFTFIADSANTYGFDSTYPTLPSASPITSIALSGAGDVSSDGGHITVIEDICLGAGGCGFMANNSILLHIADSNGTSFSHSCTILNLAGVTCSPDGTTVTFSSAVTSVSVYAQYELTGSFIGSGITSLDYFENTFGEDGVTPEPATFVLMGSALAALALLRLRK
jgi:PEP-CTERM motif